CTEDQIQDEVAGCLDMGFEIYRLFGFTPELELSTRPENRLGDDALWDRAEGELVRALESRGMAYKVNAGDGAFYGPKIDLHMTDAIGRSWQLGTVQLDYGNPERFDMTYTGADNAEHRPVVIHRALMGTFERFIGIITEHYAGDFPIWVTPVQAIVLPISDRFAPVAAGILGALREGGVRAELDERTESIGRKIREAELQKIPYMLVVGEREAADGTVAVRERHHGDIGTMPVPQLVRRIAAQARDRSA
ncbi:MAG TPA: His/Gly/Thr/Pro-type tRNA ligase C-terminal domain-containing protein, partial [Solirubrobacteraceae bacterium]|nr:His/Gly/Thr/Pro-type tRNA ligase C-terminal domain-containing protein [Solirubrobacteraceae bacterium]